MSSLILHVKDRPLAEVQLSKIFYKVLILAQKHKIIIEPNFTTLVRVFLLLATNLACLLNCLSPIQVVGTIIVEGIGRQLDPNVNIFERATPLLSQSKELREMYLKVSLSRGLPVLFK